MSYRLDIISPRSAAPDRAAGVRLPGPDRGAEGLLRPVRGHGEDPQAQAAGRGAGGEVQAQEGEEGGQGGGDQEAHQRAILAGVRQVHPRAANCQRCKLKTCN